MYKKVTCLFISIILVIFSIASCREEDNAQTTSQTSLTTVTSEMVTESTQSTTSSNNSVPIFEGSGETLFLDDESGYISNVWYATYLKNPESAWLFDSDISDGLSVREPFETVDLLPGTVMFDVSSDLFPGRNLYVLPDNRCVFFEQSQTDEGEIELNGKSLDAFMGIMSDGYTYSVEKPQIVENYELMPDTPLDHSIQPQTITINVDWNGDGIADTISRVFSDPNNLSEQIINYLDGATGEVTDITDRFATDEQGDFQGVTNEVMLMQNSNTGRYVLVDTIDTCSADYSIFAYSYDPETIITYEEIFGSFAYVDGKMYCDSRSFIFGNQGAIRNPLIFDGESLDYDSGVTEYWWMSAQVAKEQGAELPTYFTYTVEEVDAEKLIDEESQPIGIPVGTAIFPQYYQWDDTTGESGYLYFLLADGSRCRIAFEGDEEKAKCSFGGVPQEELFYCMWGG